MKFVNIASSEKSAILQNDLYVGFTFLVLSSTSIALSVSGWQIRGQLSGASYSKLDLVGFIQCYLCPFIICPCSVSIVSCYCLLILLLCVFRILLAVLVDFHLNKSLLSTASRILEEPLLPTLCPLREYIFLYPFSRQLASFNTRIAHRQYRGTMLKKVEVNRKLLAQDREWQMLIWGQHRPCPVEVEAMKVRRKASQICTGQEQPVSESTWIWSQIRPCGQPHPWRLSRSRLGAQPRQANVSMQVTCPMQNGCIDYCNNCGTKRQPSWTEVSGLHWNVLLNWSSNLTLTCQLKTLSIEGFVQIQADQGSIVSPDTHENAPKCDHSKET